ncbi:DUF4145 domain-containing protein [Roseomonas gilardii subsp. gilardii]|uniref:DUF4145 domain-containing protein n=1 Tax=Roseomonas gilardii TaxID=257708 RepID=UPI001FF743A8|nr:DUF4145 domain-containing protein [Roseomonas gilardii]UPG71621.1 DUF4145 domain-containing protein [Roseomonas gilardii subsp. gilardii]
MSTIEQATPLCPCVQCKRNTKHKVVHEIEEQYRDEYRCAISHSIIECLGCGGRSFRYVFSDFENSYPTDEHDWEVPQDIEYYPKYDPHYISLDSTHSVPELVSEIYKESIHAVQAGALTLASLGLRATIEAICNDKAISGRNLEVRIAKLATQGLISNKDAERLHAIRFLGNDAAHEIKKPRSNQVSVALKIINHLIQSVYLLEDEMSRKLDTIVTDSDEFKRLLNKHIASHQKGSEYPLAAYLGKDLRRLGAGAAQLETQLLAEIHSGTYTKLAVGKVAHYQGSKNPVQHFIIN